MLLIASIATLILGAGAASEDSVATTRPWRSSISVGGERLDGDQSIWKPWLSTSASVGRRWTRGALELQGLRTRRFGLWDNGAAIDAYHTLWRNTYGNVRVQLVPDAAVLPTLDASVEIFQALSRGWELSYGARRMDFGADATHTVDAGLARTVGDYTMRARAIALLPSSGSEKAASGGLSLRRTFRSLDDLVEAGVSAGREVVSIGGGQATDIRPSGATFVRAQRFLSPTFGIGGTATYSRQRALPSRAGLQLSLISRW